MIFSPPTLASTGLVSLETLAQPSAPSTSIPHIPIIRAARISMLLSQTFQFQNDSDSQVIPSGVPHAGPNSEALDLQVFSATWCPDCRRLERWLEANGVAHAKVDIETVPGAAERLEAETGKRAIPFILVNGKTWVRGYHRELPQRFDPDTLVRELLAAAGH